jgi:hypothetical protein
MYTAGLVVTLTQELAVMQRTLERLRAASPLTLGEPYEQFVPLAMEVEGPSHARQWHEWVASLDGVRGVEVVFVHWDESGREGEDVRN